jgi:hypothetical protein
MNPQASTLATPRESARPQESRMPDVTQTEDAAALLTPDLDGIPEDDHAEPLDAEPEHIAIDAEGPA